MRKLTWMLLALPLLVAAPAAAQTQANPEPGCSATPQQLEANKRVAMAFFSTAGDERVALVDPSYIQHNPAFVKGAREAGMSDYDYFVSRFGGPPRGGGAGRGGGRGQAAGPQPPAGNPLEVVTAECDIVTIIHMNYRQDPTEDAGTFFQAYTFDSFRVRNGKLVEHWDSAVINAPQAGRGGN